MTVIDLTSDIEAPLGRLVDQLVVGRHMRSLRVSRMVALK